MAPKTNKRFKNKDMTNFIGCCCQVKEDKNSPTEFSSMAVPGKHLGQNFSHTSHVIALATMELVNINRFITAIPGKGIVRSPPSFRKSASLHL